MKFKKTLSLLLLASLFVGISASESETKKNELEARIQCCEAILNPYFSLGFLSALSTYFSGMLVWNNMQDYSICAEVMSEKCNHLVEAIRNAITSGALKAHPDDAPGLASVFIRHVNTPTIELMENTIDHNVLNSALSSSKLVDHILTNISLAKVAAVTAGCTTLLCGRLAYQVWCESCKAQQELEELNTATQT